MAAVTIPLYYDLDLLRWTKSAGATAEQPTLVIGQRTECAFAVRFVRSGAPIELTDPVWIFGIKAINDESGDYLVQTTTGTKTGTGATTIYTFTVTLDSTELRAYLAALTTPADNFCALEIYDSANGITTLPAITVVPIESYNVTGATPTDASGTLIIASGKTVTINNSVTLIGTDGVTYDLDAAVDGPASATDNAIATFDGPTGKLIQNSGPTISANGVVNVPTATGLRVASLIVNDDSNYAISGSGAAGGGQFSSTTGVGVSATTTSGDGLHAATASGTYHARFGGFLFGNPEVAFELVRGWLVWFFGLFKGRLKTADITADRDWTLPNATGTIAVAAPSTTATHALFATSTAGAPEYRAIASTDLPIKELEKTLYPLIPSSPLDHFDDDALSVDWTLKGMVAGDFSKSSPSWAKFDLGTATGAAVQRTIHRAWAATTNATITMRCQYNSLGHGVPMIGPCFTNDAGNGIAFAGYNSGGTPILMITVVDWYYSTTPLTVVITQDFSTEQRPYWMRLRKSDTTYYFSYSLDGRVWTPESSGIVNATVMTRIGAGMFFRGAGTIYGSSFEIDYFDIT